MSEKKYRFNNFKIKTWKFMEKTTKIIKFGANKVSTNNLIGFEILLITFQNN